MLSAAASEVVVVDAGKENCWKAGHRLVCLIGMSLELDPARAA